MNAVFTTNQINQLRNIVDEYDIPVMCFGLPGFSNKTV